MTGMGGKKYEKPDLGPLGNEQGELTEEHLNTVSGGGSGIVGSQNCASGEKAGDGCGNGGYPGSNACFDGTGGGPR